MNYDIIKNLNIKVDSLYYTSEDLYYEIDSKELTNLHLVDDDFKSNLANKDLLWKSWKNEESNRMSLSLLNELVNYVSNNLSLIDSKNYSNVSLIYYCFSYTFLDFLFCATKQGQKVFQKRYSILKKILKLKTNLLEFVDIIPLIQNYRLEDYIAFCKNKNIEPKSSKFIKIYYNQIYSLFKLYLSQSKLDAEQIKYGLSHMAYNKMWIKLFRLFLNQIEDLSTFRFDSLFSSIVTGNNDRCFYLTIDYLTKNNPHVFYIFINNATPIAIEIIIVDNPNMFNYLIKAGYDPFENFDLATDFFLDIIDTPIAQAIKYCDYYFDFSILDLLINHENFDPNYMIDGNLIVYEVIKQKKLWILDKFISKGSDLAEITNKMWRVLDKKTRSWYKKFIEYHFYHIFKNNINNSIIFDCILPHFLDKTFIKSNKL